MKPNLIIGQRVYNVSCFSPNGKRARQSTRSEDSWTSAETTARAWGSAWYTVTPERAQNATFLSPFEMVTHLWGTWRFGDRSFVVPPQESFSKHKLCSPHADKLLPSLLPSFVSHSYNLSELSSVHLDLIGEIRYPQWQPTGYIKGSVMCNGPTTWPWSASPCRSRVHAGTCQNKHIKMLVCWQKVSTNESGLLSPVCFGILRGCDSDFGYAFHAPNILYSI